MLITKVKPLTSRDTEVKIPVRHVALLTIHESNAPKWSFDLKSLNMTINTIYLPSKLYNISLRKEFPNFQKLYKGYRVVYLADSYTKTKKSIAEIITFAFNLINRKGLLRYYTNKNAKILYSLLSEAISPFIEYDYRVLHFVLNADSIAKTLLTDNELRKSRFGQIILSCKNNPDFLSFIYDTFNIIFVTLVSSDKQVLHLAIHNKKYVKEKQQMLSNFRRAISIINNLSKILTKDEDYLQQIEDTVDYLINKLSTNYTWIKKFKSIIKKQFLSFAFRYPDYLQKLQDNPKLAIQIIKQLHSTGDIEENTDNVTSKESESGKSSVINIIEKLNSENIPPIKIPDKLTNDDILSATKTVELQVGNSVTFIEKSYDAIEDQIKLFNIYLEKLGYKIQSVVRKPKQTKDIKPNELDIYIITLTDKDGNEHTIEIDLPKLVGNFFYYNGVKRVLVTQLYQLPLVSFKPHEAMVRSNYSAYTIKLQTKFKYRSFFITILGKQVPLIYVYIMYFKSLENVLKHFNIKYKWSDIPCENVKIKFEFNNKYLCIDDIDDKYSLLLSGLAFYKHPDTDDFEKWKELLAKRISHRFVANLEKYFDEFIDPVTYYVLSVNNLPTDFIGLMDKALEQAYIGLVTRQTDLKHRRFRNSEILTVLIFKNLYKRIKEQQIASKTSQLRIPRDCVLKDLTSSSQAVSQFQAILDDNPLIESSFLTRVVYSGLDGIPLDAVPARMRDVDPTYWGIIDPIDTPECLSPDTKVFVVEKDNQIKQKPLKEIAIGDKLLSKDKKIVEVVNKFIKRKETIEIEFQNNIKIKTSKDHKFLVYDKKERIYTIETIANILEDTDRYLFVRE